MPTIGWDEGALFSSLSGADGCAIDTSCVGMLVTIVLFT